MQAAASVKNDHSLKVFVIVGALFFIAMSAIAGWLLFDRFQHVQNWQPVAADVTWSGTLCEMQYKSGKSWNTADVVECSDVQAYKDGHPERNWRSTETDYVRLAYQAGGAAQDLTINRYRVSTAPIAAGGKAAIFVDPADPVSIDRAIAFDDYRTSAILALVGAGLMIACIALGIVISHFNKRKNAEKAASAHAPG